MTQAAVQKNIRWEMQKYRHLEIQARDQAGEVGGAYERSVAALGWSEVLNAFLTVQVEEDVRDT